jgi:PST family polysaccharide transporter
MNLMQTAASVAALGLGTVGTRQIAAASAEGGEEAVGRTRRALFWGTMGLALIGAISFWLCRGWIARVVLDDPGRSGEVGWLALGVALTVAAASQGALLTGLRRVTDLAWINAGAGVLGSALGVLALWLRGPQGLLVMVLVAPVVSFTLGHVFVARLRRPAERSAGPTELSRELRTMIRLGVAFMISGLATMLGHLTARTLVQRELGTEALGHFQAAWSIGMTYLGFVLGAMGTDYYPRLAAAIRDHPTAVRLVNEQTEVALLLCAPVIVAMLGLAPLAIQLLYSADFAPSVAVLRWQLLGDILKVMSWPLGYVLLAAGAGKTFVLTESVGMGVFVLGVHVGLPIIGVSASGVAFLALYGAYLPVLFWLAKRRIGFRWSRTVKAQAVAATGLSLATGSAAWWSDLFGAVAGMLLAALLSLWSVLLLLNLSNTTDRLGSLGGIGVRAKAWLKKR